MGEIKLYLDGLDCAGCAAKIENRVNKLAEVEEASLNFATKTLFIKGTEESKKENLIAKATEIVNKLEPHVIVTEQIKKIPIKKLASCNCQGHSRDHDHNNKTHVNCCESNSNLEIHSKNEDNLHFEDSSHEDYHSLNESSQSNHSHHEHSHDGHSHESQSHGEHSHGELSNKKIIKFSIALIIYAIALIFKFDFNIELTLFLISYILVGGDIVLQAIKNIFHGEVFDENFLMAVATIGAFAIKEFPEAVAVMIFYQLGEMFQDLAVNRSRKSIADLMDIRPDYANLLKNDKEEMVSPESVTIGDLILVKPGEKIPLDGVVLRGEAMVDTSALTGESVPRTVKKDSEVLAGCINKNGVLTIKVTKSFGESTVSKILDLVQNAGNKKAPTEKFITKFARYYTPAVVFSALALVILPPLLIPNAIFSDWLYRALTFLVVSCPCALVVSIPLGFFGGIGAASKHGVLVKGGNYLEALNNVETVIFDKTGTLTKGVFKVTKIVPKNINEAELLEMAAYTESFSKHPIATSIVTEYGKVIDKTKLDSYEEISGHGIKVNLNGNQILAGNSKLMQEFKINFKDVEEMGTVVHLAVNNEYKGYILISDEIKADSKTAIKELKELGVKETIMLTGDNKKVATLVAKELNIDSVYSELLPHNKVEKLEEIDSKKSKKGKIIFVGDGINDAPVLARADIGIAMGGVGSDAAIEAADVVIMTDEPSKIASAIRVAKKTNKIVWQNIIFALTVKLIILLLVALGLGTMWEAVFGDVGVALIAVLNSLRVLKTK